MRPRLLVQGADGSAICVPQVLLLAPPPVAVGRSWSALTGFAEIFEGEGADKVG